MKRTLLYLFGAGLLSFCLLGTAHAAKPDKDDHPGKGKSNKERGSEMRSEPDAERAGLASDIPQLTRDQENELIRLILGEDLTRAAQASQGSDRTLPQGLQMKLDRGGQLPPGWQKKLQRGEQIDSITYNEAERFPDELLRRVTGREDAVELLQVGDRLLRVVEGRGTILDVIDLTDRTLRMLE